MRASLQNAMDKKKFLNYFLKEKATERVRDVVDRVNGTLHGRTVHWIVLAVDPLFCVILLSW
jgi:hypothetical protein